MSKNRKNATSIKKNKGIKFSNPHTQTALPSLRRSFDDDAPLPSRPPSPPVPLQDIPVASDANDDDACADKTAKVDVNGEYSSLYLHYA